ncbi:MAG TPA: site-2 protease family protein [Candidatus Saccharimonadales bacterium]|nr:site-2 protease family protein [Candidatus Saccharimonadales bacterium]
MINSDIDIGTIVIIFISLAASITLHEAMHAFTSHWLGDDTASLQGRVSLNPIRHVDPFATLLLPLITLLLFQVPLLAAKPVPFNPFRVRFGEFGAALVGIAGPLTNLLLALTAAGFLNLFRYTADIGVIRTIAIFMIVNIGLFVFNMIPIPPLDGSRLLYAFAPESFQAFMASLEGFGVIIVFSLILLVPVFVDLLIRINDSIIHFLVPWLIL